MLAPLRHLRAPFVLLSATCPLVFAALACTTVVEEVTVTSDAGPRVDASSPKPSPTGDAASTPTPTPEPPPSSTADAGKKDAPLQPTIDAGPPTCGLGGSVTTADVEQAFNGPWKGPGAPKNVCTQADIDALKQLFATANSVKFTDIKAAVTATCGACVFTSEASATWGPLVEFQDGTYQNYAACYATVSNNTCGQNLAYSDICFEAVCDDAACGSAQAKQTCIRQAVSNQCSTFTTGIQQSCGANLDSLDAKCGNLFQLIGVTCGGGIGSTLDAAAP